MRNILLSCFGKTDKSYEEYLSLLVEESDNYKAQYKIEVLKDKEREYIEYLLSCYTNSSQFPTKDLFLLMYSELGMDAFNGAQEIPLNDLRVYIFNWIDSRTNIYINKRIDYLNKTIKSKGITDEIKEELDELERISNRNKVQDINIDIDINAIYQEKKLKPQGMLTGIKAIDEKIGGMNEGTVSTIAGFTSQYKTTFALNIAHLNSYYYGYNIAYISLETPKEDMWWNLLSCHSYLPHLSKMAFVGHDRMRKSEMTPAEEDFVFKEVLPDLNSDIELSDGTKSKRGRIIFLDESDFNTFSFSEISKVMETVDDKLDGKLDAVIVDYAQLCKFSGPTGHTSDANSQINSYVTFFRRLGQSFRKVKDPVTGEEITKRLVIIILSQINRGSWQKAARNEGKYDLTCLADANELERGSFRVFTTYTNEDLKGRKSAQVQILKNRTGQTMYDPELVYADGEAYVFQDENGASQGAFGGDGQMSMDAAFSGMADSDLSALGI